MKNPEIYGYSLYQEQAKPLIEKHTEIQEKLRFLEAQVQAYRDFFKETASQNRALEVSRETQSYNRALKEIEDLVPKRDDLVRKISELINLDANAEEILDSQKSKYTN